MAGGHHGSPSNSLPGRLLFGIPPDAASTKATGFIDTIQATLKFPQDFPFNPPTFAFDDSFFHPNVYVDGKLCISILHPPGDDPMRYSSVCMQRVTQCLNSLD